MSWISIIAVTWLLIAVLAGLLIGRAIRAADRKDLVGGPVLDEPNIVVDLPVVREFPHRPRAAEGPPTIPGIPSARPTVDGPPASPSSGTAPPGYRRA